MAVRIRGLRETERAFRKMSGDLDDELRKGLKKAGEPVAETARGKISRYRGASIGTIAPRLARGTTVFVTQRARKVTGKRGDFGSLQMKKLFESLEEREGDVIRQLEQVLDDLTDSGGF
jgi:hypothetical protein